MANFVPIDYVFLGIIVIFAVVALIKGFIQELFSKASWVCAILGAVFFYQKISALYHNSINSVILCNVLGFLTLFIIIFVVVKLTGMLISKLSDFSIIKGLDKALGLFFGIVEGFAVVAFILFLLKTQTFFSTEQLLDHSFFYKLIQNFINNPEIHDVMTNKAVDFNNTISRENTGI